MDEMVQFLQKTEVFHGLGRDEVQEVIRLFETVSLKEGDPVVYMGDESASVFLITSGQCKVFIPFDFGMGENVLSYLKKGDLFGEMGVVTGRKRSANITCFTDVGLLVMSGEDFWKVANRYPAILKNIISILSERLVAQNLRARPRKRTSLNLHKNQRDALDYFYWYVESQNQNLIDRMIHTEVPRRKFGGTPFGPLKSLGHGITRAAIKSATKPYISKIEGLENIPNERPVIFLLSFRTVFDFLFLYKVYDHLDSPRSLSFALCVGSLGKIALAFLRGLLFPLNLSYLSQKESLKLGSAEDAANLLNHMASRGKTVDVALYPFLERSMGYDRMMGYHHFNIWLKTGEARDIIPVAISGTDKFWPFEPWNRKFFDVSSFLNFKSVEIKIGEKICLKDMGFKEQLDACGGDEQRIKALFDKTNLIIGSRMAALHDHVYNPVYQDVGQVMLRSVNEKWTNRLSLMLPAGLGLRKKYKKSSVKIRHFTWHAEMLNVFLEHLEEENYCLPAWAKGSLIAGASYADLDWPFFSMNHSFNPYTEKGMKLGIRFPHILSLLKKEMDNLLCLVENDGEVDKVLIKMGKIYHFLSDLAVPAHVHNIPHLFVDLPKIGKCDFEEYLGLDQPLLRLNQHEIGDLSSHRVETLEEFYQCVHDIAQYTFLHSSFDYEQLQGIAKDRMIHTFEDKKDLIRRLKKTGVEVLPVQGITEDERYYVRNLTSRECAEINEKTIYYSLKAIASCFIFLIHVVADIQKKKNGQDPPHPFVEPQVRNSI